VAPEVLGVHDAAAVDLRTWLARCELSDLTVRKVLEAVDEARANSIAQRDPRRYTGRVRVCAEALAEHLIVTLRFGIEP
jgi:hypothetical protein